jgi:hypothetical protein
MAFLGINVGPDKESLMQLFVRMYKVTYPVGRDHSGRILELFRVEATPTTLFIDRQGRLVDRVEGGLEPPEMLRRIDALLR